MEHSVFSLIVQKQCERVRLIVGKLIQRPSTELLNEPLVMN